MIWLIKYWRVLAIVGGVIAASLALYGKGRADANAVWELKHQRELVAMYEAGVKALQKQRAQEARMLEAHQREIKSVMSRPPLRGVYLCNNVPDSRPSGGVDGSNGPRLPVPIERDLGEALSDIADEADLCAYRLNRLQEWVRNATVPVRQTKPR